MISVGHRLWLRENTLRAHSGVEQMMAAHDPSCCDGYSRFLLIQDRAVCQCEAAIEHAGGSAIIRDWPRRKRAETLLRDLAALRLWPHRAAIQPMPLSRFQAFGLLYVLEGSRLGGQVLAKRLQRNPCPVCRSANRFLDHGQGLDLWGSFVRTLDRVAASATNRQAMLEGARLGFSAFGAAVAKMKAPGHD